MNSDAITSSKTEIIEVNDLSIDHNEAATKSPAEPQIGYFERFTNELRRLRYAIMNFLFGVYFAWATYHIVDLKKTHTNELAENVTAEQPINMYCQGYCGIRWCDGYGMLLILTILVYTGLLMNEMSKRKWLHHIAKCIRRTSGKFSIEQHSKSLAIVGLAVGVIFLYFDTNDSRDRLRSLSGVFILFGLGYLFSKHPSKIHWRPVIVGFVLQFLLGLFCIRMEIGRRIFNCMGQKVSALLSFARIGSRFVFGDLLVHEHHILIFSVLTVIYFTSFIISISYYLGAMQWLVQKLGAPLRLALGTTVCESMATASNIFFGLTDTTLMIKPFIKFLTASEIHALLTSCFATVAGDVLAAYISFGAEPAHLITSSIMAAPAALCFSKLFFPETEQSQTTADNCHMEKSTDSSVLEAASNGASTATNLILGIAANLVAFVSFMAFINSLTGWLGHLVGFDGVSFELFFGKLFIPLAYIIGIPWEDCEKIAAIIASKTIVNEFVAYQRLGVLKAAGEITLRSSAITTFAICGFANPGSLGIMIGMITIICPEKKKTVASVGLRAFIAGSCVNFLNASIAGLLMPAALYDGSQ